MDLNSLKCVACKIGAPVLKGQELEAFMKEISDWELYDGKTKLKKEFVFDNFKMALDFVNRVGKIAETEGHHPNIYMYDYKKVRIELWTHKIGGLHQNDFILAAKVDLL